MEPMRRDLVEDDRDDAWIAGDAPLSDPEPPEPASPWTIVRGRRATMVALGAAFVAVVAAWGFWPRAAGTEVALAVPAADAAAARATLVAAGIPAAQREGALWVPAAQVRTAIETLAAARPAPNAMASALADESVFASSDQTRARRLAATMQALESAIAQQPGVARAQVVLTEAHRSGAPGSASGGAAAVTVTMRSGPMPQDLVDAVAVLVCGASPGLRPEQVAILDAVAGRARQPRGAEERAVADIVRAREERANALLAAMLTDIPGVRVAVREAESGGMVATIHLPRGYLQARALTPEGTVRELPAVLATERDRIAAMVEPFLQCPAGNCPTAVAVAMAADAGDAPAASSAEVGIDAPAPAEPFAARSPSQVAFDGAARERTTPLGPGGGPAPSFPWGWAFLTIVGAAAVGSWTLQRTRPGAGRPAATTRAPAIVEPVEPEPIEESPALAAASEAVRAAPEQASEVVRGWLDAGYESRAAHLLVALDAGAAGLVLRGLPVRSVQSATAALGETEAPAPEELAEAAEGFLAEMELEPSATGYRGGPERS
ncbi:MAG: hypothetical protein U0625_11385 [Phycisphaerales bacterium]